MGAAIDRTLDGLRIFNRRRKLDKRIARVMSHTSTMCNIGNFYFIMKMAADGDQTIRK